MAPSDAWYIASYINTHPGLTRKEIQADLCSDGMTIETICKQLKTMRDLFELHRDAHNRYFITGDGRRAHGLGEPVAAPDPDPDPKPVDVPAEVDPVENVGAAPVMDIPVIELNDNSIEKHGSNFGEQWDTWAAMERLHVLVPGRASLIIQEGTLLFAFSGHRWRIEQMGDLEALIRATELYDGELTEDVDHE